MTRSAGKRNPRSCFTTKYPWNLHFLFFKSISFVVYKLKKLWTLYIKEKWRMVGKKRKKDINKAPYIYKFIQIHHNLHFPNNSFLFLWSKLLFHHLFGRFWPYKRERATYDILNRLNNTKGGWRLRSFPSGLHNYSNASLSLCNVRKSWTTKSKNWSSHECHVTIDWTGWKSGG